MDPNFSGKEFDPILWNEQKKLESQYYYVHRCSMAESLKKILEEQKMTKQEVLELLGKPGRYNSEGLLYYRLGYCGGFIDFYSILIYLDNNRVYKVRFIDG